MQDIRRLEEAGLAGLPALRTDYVDGWILRFADGYSRRANSVQSLYPSSPDARLDLTDKVRACERAYARHGLPCLFKISPASAAGLDELLADRGYRRDADTLVCVRPVEPAPADASGTDEAHGGAVVLDVADGEWFDTWSALSGTGSDDGTFGRLLAGTAGPTAYALVRHDGVGVACGRATISGDLVGLNDLLVHPQHRRRGHATALTRARLAWAAEHGARTAYLQVMAANDDARRLQARLGFEEAYRYWYRVQPGPEAPRRC